MALADWDGVKNPTTAVYSGIEPIYIAQNVIDAGTKPAIVVPRTQDYNLIINGDLSPGTVYVEWELANGVWTKLEDINGNLINTTVQRLYQIGRLAQGLNVRVDFSAAPTTPSSVFLA